MKVQGARPVLGLIYEIGRFLARWLVPPCVHFEELGHHCYVCAERSAQQRRASQRHGDDR